MTTVDVVALYRVVISQVRRGGGIVKIVRPYLLLRLPNKKRATGRYGFLSALSISEETYQALRRLGAPLVTHTKAKQLLLNGVP
jgi:hypothetical protein